MLALIFEMYGAVCLLSLIVFLILAAVAKLRPDLDEEEFDFGELEKLKELVNPDLMNPEPAVEPVSIEPSIMEEQFFWPPPARPVKKRRRSGGARVPRFFPAGKARLV